MPAVYGHRHHPPDAFFTGDGKSVKIELIPDIRTRVVNHLLRM